MDVTWLEEYLRKLTNIFLLYFMAGNCKICEETSINEPFPSPLSLEAAMVRGMRTEMVLHLSEIVSSASAIKHVHERCGE